MLRDAARGYLLTVALARFADRAIFTTSTLFLVSGLGLGPLQLTLLGTALELAVLLGELPTGVVADVHGRRRSVATGYLLTAVAHALQGSLPWWAPAGAAFPALLAIQVLRGLAATFVSGAHAAWIADEVGPERAGRLFVQADRLGLLAGVAGIAAGTASASAGLNLPYLVGAATYLALGLLVTRLPETAFRPRGRAAGAPWWSPMRETVREGLALVRARPELVRVLVASAAAGAAAEGWDRLAGAHFLLTLGLPGGGRLAPPLVFGLLALGHMAVSFTLLTALGSRLTDGDAPALARRLQLLAGLRAAAVVGFALAGGPLAGVLLYWTAAGLRALYEPLYLNWLNRQLESRVRATVLSLEGQANALGETAGGPAVGLLADRGGLRLALTAAGLLLLPALAAFRRARAARAALARG